MGKVVHFEIPTDDLDRAKAFYAEVFGWKLDTMQMPGGGDYTGATTTPVDDTMTPTEPGSINGALVNRDEGNSAPVVTIDVDNIDEALQQISAAGGSTVTPRPPAVRRPPLSLCPMRRRLTPTRAPSRASPKPLGRRSPI